MLYSECVTDSTVAALLPVNALRNAATLPARTDFVAMLDVDLLPSKAFLSSFNGRQDMLHAVGLVAIAPRNNVTTLISH